MNKIYFAILLKSLAVFFIVSMDVLIKKLSINFPTFQIVFFRCLFGLLPVTFMLFLTKSKLKTSKIKIHIIRAIIATMVMFCFFKSISLLSLADVSSISFASIMITTILAIFVLKEKVGLKRWIAIIVGFLGVLVVFRPGTSIFSYYSFLPLIAALGLSFAIILLKQLLNFDKPPTCSFYLHFLIAIFVLPSIYFGWRFRNLNEWYFIILMYPL